MILRIFAAAYLFASRLATRLTPAPDRRRVLVDYEPNEATLDFVPESYPLRLLVTEPKDEERVWN